MLRLIELAILIQARQTEFNAMSYRAYSHISCQVGYRPRLFTIGPVMTVTELGDKYNYVMGLTAFMRYTYG